MRDHNLVPWLLVRWSEPEPGSDDLEDLCFPRRSQQIPPHKTCGGGIIAMSFVHGISCSRSFRDKKSSLLFDWELEEKLWRATRQAQFLSSRLTAARLPSAGGGTHAIKVRSMRSTGLSERRRKLLQVPCRNTRYQRTDARSNFTLAEHQSSLQMSVAMSCFVAWQINIAIGGVKMQVRPGGGGPTSRQGTRPRCCLAQNLPNIRY